MCATVALSHQRRGGRTVLTCCFRDSPPPNLFVLDQSPQRLIAARLDTNRFNYRYTQRFRQNASVDMDSASKRNVSHVECNNDW